MKIQSAELYRSVHTAGDLPSTELPELALAGRSNVGKSSLLNRLLGRPALARVSSTPGRTRGVNYFLVNGRFFVVDLPGYGWARAARTERERWAGVIEEYLRHEHSRRELLLLVDAEVGATPLDCQAAEYLLATDTPFAIVATKIDRLGRGARPAALARIRAALGLPAEAPVYAFSARTGEGARELWRHAEDFFAVARAPHEKRKEEHA